MTPCFRRSALAAASLSTLTLLAACGGGDGAALSSAPGALAAAAPAPAPAPTPAPAPAPAPAPPAIAFISGSVAVGTPITNGTLRVLDASGAVVASGVPIDANGHYADVALSGPAPYRIEACGYAGPNYQCIYSVASAGGTANVTPLTTAAVLLAAGQAPDSLMSGTASGLTGSSIAAAQDQLRSGLASVLSSAGVSGTFDFVSGDLAAGSRSGYDGVLDAVGVTLGQDANAFVQITPRLGSGNLYLEQGSSSGSVTSITSAASLQLSGLETLFADMSNAIVSSAACAGESSGIQRSLAANAQMSMGGGTAQGPAQVAQALCSFFGQGDDGSTPIWGSRLLSPTLGHCDLSGAAPVCGVSFVLQSPQGDVQPVANGMGVTQEAGRWKFLGDMLPVHIEASARAQRTRRIDGPAPLDEYGRALAFEVTALPGLACAQVSQRDSSGTPTTIGYYKRHAGATDQQRLALWTRDGFGNDASTDPLAGFTRSADDTWIALPQGTEGDAVIRNFYRGGRNVTVSLYADGNCSAPFSVAGRSQFEVEVSGVPPVWSALPSLPWPEIDADSQSALRTLAVAAGASGSLHASWTFPRGPLGLNGATVCGSRGECGQGGAGRLGDRSLRPGAIDMTVALRNRSNDVSANDPKTLGLYGNSGDGVGLESNYSSCPTVTAETACH